MPGTQLRTFKLQNHVGTMAKVVDGSSSESALVESCVPRGRPTVLGPPLFLIYINDIPSSTVSSQVSIFFQMTASYSLSPDKMSSRSGATSKVRPFADDAIVYSEINSISDSQILQQDLGKSTLLEKTWLMEFNPIKCESPLGD